MIIAAYSGTGKSSFGARFENAVDLASMPWHRILPPKNSEEENESGKGRMDVFTDPLYPDNYIIHILRAEREHDYVLIPTDMQVVRRLREQYGRTIVLCYPGDELKDEYRERFIARGNSEDFLNLFIERWDNFLEPVREYEDAVHIVMGAGEYLTDLKERFDREFLSDSARPVPEETVAELEQELQGQRKDFALCLSWCFWYRIPDILDQDERYFLAGISKKTNAEPFIVPLSYADELPSPERVITDDKARVLEYLERHYPSSILNSEEEQHA